MLNQQQIISDLLILSKTNPICLAYSGGIDSHVLLHLLATSVELQSTKIRAIYIDHGLNELSAQWRQHCADIALSLNIEFDSITVKVENIAHLGMEAAAREARYTALKNALKQNEVLLTAQHQDDQAETVLLQLLRGAGPKGLSAMAQQSHLGNNQLIRPLLHCSQSDIVHYGQQHQLSWIEDPSNSELRWNRNYIRHKLWPEIKTRWPQAAKTISRSAKHCAETSELLDELAASDLTDFNVDISANTLPIPPLLNLSIARRNNLIRYFIGLKHFSMPSMANLHRIIDDVCLAKRDAVPVVTWPGVDVRRYQDRLYFMANLAKYNTKAIVVINNSDDCQLDALRTLKWQQRLGQGIPAALFDADLSIRFRQGGERIKPQGKQHHTPLKHLFQLWNVPPWQRDRIPLLFSGDELVAVVGYCVSDLYSVKHDEQGLIAQVI